MKKKNKSNVLNYIVYSLIILVVFIGLWTLFDSDVFDSKSSNFTTYNDYRIFEEDTGVITLYVVEVISEDKTYNHKFRNYPTDLLNIDYKEGIEDIVLNKNEDEYKNKIYISVDPDMTGQEVLSTGILAQILGRESYGVFKIKSVVGAFSKDYEGNDHPVKNCDDASKEIGIILLQYGEPKVYSEGDCVIVQGQDVEDFRRLNERLAYGLLEVIE